MNWGLPESSTMAPDVDLLFWVLLGVSSLIVAVVFFGILYLCVRYRQGSSAHREGAPEKSTRLEWALVLFMLTFSLTCYFWATRVFYRMWQAPANAIEVSVVAKRWMWIFHDPRVGDQINRLRVPLGRPVRLIMTSDDVIHSFFVPNFRLKQDVLPGRYTSLWFEAKALGSFEVLCTQYCGLEHSAMRAVIEVLPPDEYESLKPEGLADSEFAHGQSLFFAKGCRSCHDGANSVGPSLRDIYGSRVELTDGSSALVDENYLRDSILRPDLQIVRGFSGVMPSYQGQLSEEELLALIHYIKREGRK